MGGKRVFLDDIEQQIIKMHREGKCLCEIAETFNIGMETIRRRLRQHGYSNMRSFNRPGYEFYCRWCCKKVVVDPQTGDHRTVFCSASCEKKYWKHPNRFGTGTRLIKRVNNK